MGGWLFRHRTIIPLPLALLLLLPAGRPALAGLALIAAGEALRLWAVRHIGTISRTRQDRLGPLVDTGPFALARNPLYIGNIMLWVGFALVAARPWLVALVLVLLAFEYHAIVRWEEQLLVNRLGERYRAYAARVPRWIPTLASLAGLGRAGPEPRTHSWPEVLFSERGTLVAIAAGCLLLWLKARG